MTKRELEIAASAFTAGAQAGFDMLDFQVKQTGQTYPEAIAVCRKAVAGQEQRLVEKGQLVLELLRTAKSTVQ